MLTDSISNAITAINVTRNAKEQKKSADNFIKVLGNLNAVTSDLTKNQDIIIALQESSIVDGPILYVQLRDEIIAQINVCGSCLYDGSLSAANVADLKKLSTSMETQLKTVWTQKALQYSDGPKSYLSLISGLTENKKEARDLVNQISKNASSSPTKTTIKQLEADVDKANKIIAEFEINPQIEAFLKKVANQQATLVDVTPEILEWLKTKNLRGKMRVIL